MRNRSCLILALVLLTGVSQAQLLSGRVLSEKGLAASGISVHFKNKANSISTNPDGSFKIMATKLPDTLVFSGIGFEPYTVIITEKNIKDPKFEVVLLNDRKALDEVVVVGYGAARKKDMTYSATGSVPELEGRVAGLSVKGRTSGHEKSSVRIRGSSTMGAGSPLAYEGKVGYFRDSIVEPRDGMLAKSRILTAGEVNDFNKWKMWEDYTEGEFKSMSVIWGLQLKKRYSVQLTDRNANAITNEMVFLINKETKDTTWKAYTDNTGKAELWARFLRDSSGKDEYIIADRFGNTVKRPAEFHNGMNVLVADKACQVSSEVDIAFVVDATGSMGDEIEFLKLELEDVIRKTMEKYNALSFRAASVFYRDKGDEYLAKNVGFSDDLLKAINFIKLQSAKGGGDTPEAVDDALSTALDSLQWNPSARTRLLFLILDAPPHREATTRIQQLILKAAALGVRIIPLACSGTDKSTEYLLRSMALATNGTYAFLSNHSGVGNPHIEPTTDKYDVELLNNLLQRIIGQFLFAKDCNVNDQVNASQVDTRQPANILSLKLFPNPTNGRFTIESNKDIKDMFIADFTGKLLMRIPAGRKGRWQTDISGYPSGMYLVKYITNENKWGSEKVILVQ